MAEDRAFQVRQARGGWILYDECDTDTPTVEVFSDGSGLMHRIAEIIAESEPRAEIDEVVQARATELASNAGRKRLATE